MTIDPRIANARITGPGRSQYDELDRAFGVPEPVNGTPQRPMTTAERAAELVDNAADLVDTANLGRLEELTTALEVLYRDGVGYPFRDAIGELGHNLSTARGHLARARRMYAEELDRLEAAAETSAADYRNAAETRDELGDRLYDEQARRRHAEEVLRQLEELPGFLTPQPPGNVYQIDADSYGRIRNLISAHTDYVAGPRITTTPTPGPGPQPRPGPSLRDLLSELGRRLDTLDRAPNLARMCRAALDTIPTVELDLRPGT